MKENKREQELLVKGLGVFELRGLAREMGIPSPTTKKRDDLINLILEKAREGVSYERTEKRKGRPFKKLNSIDEIVNTMIESQTKQEKITFESLISFAQDFPMEEEICKDCKMDVYEGILRQDKDIFAFYSNGTFVFIDKAIEGFDKLRRGDKVKVEAETTVNKNKVAVKILEINGVGLTKYQASKVENGEEIISNETLPFGENVVYVGRRNACSYDQSFIEENELSEILAYAQKNDIEIILLGVNTSYEDQLLLKQYDYINNFTTEYGSNAEKNFNKIIDAIFYSQNLIERGKKSLFIIIDIMEVLYQIDKTYGVNYYKMEHCDQAIVIMQKIMSLGKAYSDGRSSTVLLGYNNCDKENPFLVNEILKICKKIK